MKHVIFLACCLLVTPFTISANQLCSESNPCRLLEFTKPAKHGAYVVGERIDVSITNLHEDILNTSLEDRVKLSISIVTTEDFTPSHYYQNKTSNMSDWALEYSGLQEDSVTTLADNITLRTDYSGSLFVSEHNSDEKFLEEEAYRLKAVVKAVSYRGDSESLKEQIQDFNETAKNYVSYSDVTFKMFQTEDDLQTYRSKLSQNGDTVPEIEKESTSYVQPEQKESFETTYVRTRDNLNVRVSPGGELIKQVPQGTSGRALTPANVENGGYWWVKVRFDNGVEGYVASSFLVTDGPGAPSVTSQVQDTDTLLQIQTLMRMVEVLQERLRILQASQN